MMSSCAVKQESGCISSSLLVSKNNDNINLSMQDNGCKYTIKKMPENIWKIEVENGSFAAFTPLVEKKAKKNLPVIRKMIKKFFYFLRQRAALLKIKMAVLLHISRMFH